MDRGQLTDFARRYTAAWCSGEPARVAEHYSEAGSLTINDGEPSVGRAAISQAALSFMSAFPDLQVLMDDLRIQDPGIEYHWTLIGTNSGPGGTGNKDSYQRVRGLDDRRGRAHRRVARTLRPGRLRPTTRRRQGIGPGRRAPNGEAHRRRPSINDQRDVAGIWLRLVEMTVRPLYLDQAPLWRVPLRR